MIQAKHINNDNSKILSGNGLFIATATLNNHSLKGQRTIDEKGTKFWNYRHKGKKRGRTEYTKRARPFDYLNKSVTSIDLQLAQVVEHTRINHTALASENRDMVNVENQHHLNAVNENIKTNKSLNQLSESAITNNPAIGNISIAEAENIADLFQPTTVIETENWVDSTHSAIESKPNNLQPDESITQIDKQQYEALISYVEPNTSIPQNSIYIVNKSPQSNYLIETDPKFTNRKKWLSSDYMFQRLRFDPDNIQKRLGDGYYEQQLIREQIVGLTGHRYLGDYSNDIEQYKALMNAGIEFAQIYGLKIGASLSAEQMQLLTTDIVWMESKTIMVDGQAISVLVPQVYLVNRPQLTAEGALLAGKNVNIQATDDIETSGSILGKEHVALLANNINNQGIIDANSISIKAKDTINSSGKLTAGKQVLLAANNDINLQSTTATTATYYGKNKSINTVLDQVSTISVKDGDISLHAGHDINLGAALLINGGEAGETDIIANNNINLTTLKTQSNQEDYWNKNNYRKVNLENSVGTEILTNNDLNLIAGNDIRIKSAEISSNKSLNLRAKHDIAITSDQERLQLTDHHKTTSKSLLSKESTTSHIEIDNATQKGSELSANSVTIKSGHDLDVSGSMVIATQDVYLNAGNNVNITAAEENYYRYEERKTKKSGVSTSSKGISVGSQSTKATSTANEVNQSQAGSLIGTSGGNVIIAANKQVTIDGSDIIAGRAQGDNKRATGHIDISGEDILIIPGRDIVDKKQTYKSKSSGVGISFSNPITDSMQNMRDIFKSSGGKVEKAKQFTGELAALAMDIGNPASLPISYHKSSTKSQSSLHGEYSSGST
ncbi:hemagglutinin repeat-containing protein, partial [Gilliamella apicola]